MQNDTTFTRDQAATYDSLLTLTVETIGSGRGIDSLRAAFSEFVDGDSKALAWFDWEYGVPQRRYNHSTLSNGKVVSEPVSG